MSTVVPHILLAAGVCVGMMVSPARAAAQGTQTVTFNFTVPVSGNKLHPAVTAIRPYCVVYLGNGALPVASEVTPAWIPVAELPKSVSARYEMTVPADAGGKAGRYTCRMSAQAGPFAGVSTSGTQSTLSRSAQDVRLKTNPMLPDSVAGTFTF
jgi:hypothetical protein